MPLLEHDDHWELPLVEGRVTQLRIDYAFSILIDAKGRDALVRINCPFAIRLADGRTINADPGSVGSVSQLPGLLFNARVDSFIVKKDGHLELVFDGTTQLSVAPHPQYEAWEFSGEGVPLVVCGPGGGNVASFGGE